MQGAAPSGNEEARLWRRFRADGDADARQQLLALHMPYARVLAGVYFSRRFTDEIEYGDFLQYASIGLLEALERYDPERGVQFRTFAARRMHGAILSGVERLTERQQQIAARQRLRSERLQDAKAAAGEPGAGHGGQPAQLMRFVSEVGIGLAICWLLEGTGLVEDPEAATTLPFYRNAAVQQLRTRLLQAIDELPATEQSVIRAHYLQDKPFEEVAGMLHLTRGRISQVHRQALQRLRTAVREQADWNATF